jgi:hypothetical protein
LKVGNEFPTFTLAFYPFSRIFQLGYNAFPGFFSKLPTAISGAENATADTNRPIPVGTGEACVNAQFVDLTTKKRLIMFVQSFVHFLSPRKNIGSVCSCKLRLKYRLRTSPSQSLYYICTPTVQQGE